MYSYNRGEWSEFYAPLFLLEMPTLNLVASDINPIGKTIHTIKSIILQSKFKLEYKIKGNSILFYAENKYIEKFSKEEIGKEKEKIINAILTSSSRDGAFEIEDMNDFVNHFTSGRSFKGKSRSKSDLDAIVYDSVKNKDVELSYSIKSQLGSSATILNSSKNTDFRYIVNNFPISEIDKVNSIKTREKLLDRIEKIKSYDNVSINFDSVVSPTFNHNLLMIDSLMPRYLGNALLYSYEANNKNLDEIFTTSNSNLDKTIAKKKLCDFLSAISFGFIPGKEWDGVNVVNGGLIVVKRDGDVVVLDLIYYPQEVSKYLIKNSKLDSPSSTRYKMLDLYSCNGKVYFNLNLQIRYKS